MYSKELVVATQAVRKASLLTRRIQSQVISNRNNSTIIKDDKSPVTVGDFAAQTIIINTIKANFPNDSIVGEESADDLSDEFLSRILSLINENDEIYTRDYPCEDDVYPFKDGQDFPLATTDDVRRVINMGNYQGGRSGRFWCLDPIDGTKGFLRGDQFSVCLAFIVDGKPQIGCVGCPNLSLESYGGQDTTGFDKFGYLYRAHRDHGAFISVASLPRLNWSALKCNTLTDTNQMVSLEGVERAHSDHDEQDMIKSRLGMKQTRHLDSNVKYCLLASGLGDAYLRIPLTMEFQEKIWDHAAGNVIVLESGGIHTDAMENVPLDFGNGRTLATKGVIATCGPAELHTKVVTTAGEIIRSRKH
ncbi:hypothetical protein TBLA_0G03110 [Henningerozyma blattae CBS 6284]|uniref:3'(2'),5'-bisphosphate nucleotidase n=1 Tax=Henningerozyma blattae (strain ATCC 34711 / CBS 6284 / DSM 70876 / NBRC 10599 / NRRL Y-10934 / UCD 77-7) TaxID=1071380 RepID=I2H796_HENB6|nr:hypothetical protein TBLA_0G03110 [Tetrapisispora blattae CBS 6284]CCH62248.1 hypothetical protein TBLA_0G03110 [Tetrapisispora blattae CBS 6284]